MAQDREELRRLYEKHLKELKAKGIKVDIILDTTPDDADWIKNIKRT